MGVARWNYHAGSVEEEYDSAAAAYDARWTVYINETVEAVLARALPSLQALPCGAVCKMLDVGCGTGAFAAALQQRFPHWQIVCSDVSAEMLRHALGRNLSVVQASSESLPFSEASFDIVTTLSSFHFWTRPDLGLRELHRVLRPSGMLVLSDWSHDFVSCKLCTIYLWLFGYPRQDWAILSAHDANKLLTVARFSISIADMHTIELRPFGWTVGPKWGMMTFVAVRG